MQFSTSDSAQPQVPLVASILALLRFPRQNFSPIRSLASCQASPTCSWLLLPKPGSGSEILLIWAGIEPKPEPRWLWCRWQEDQIAQTCVLRAGGAAEPRADAIQVPRSEEDQTCTHFLIKCHFSLAIG